MPAPVAYGVAWYRAESAFIREIIPQTSVAREEGDRFFCFVNMCVAEKDKKGVASHEREE